MNISTTMQEAINNQINAELYSSYLYLAMAAHFEAASLPGFANWMRIQAEEEREHAMKFFNFLLDRGGRVQLKAIDAPPAEFGDALSIFEEVLKHEQKVTGLIYKLYEQAGKENDYATQVMLHWFIDEQVEEEKNASEIVAQLKMLGEPQLGRLLQLDHRLGKREAE